MNPASVYILAIALLLASTWVITGWHYEPSRTRRRNARIRRREWERYVQAKRERRAGR